MRALPCVCATEEEEGEEEKEEGGEGERRTEGPYHVFSYYVRRCSYREWKRGREGRREGGRSEGGEEGGRRGEEICASLTPNAHAYTRIAAEAASEDTCRKEEWSRQQVRARGEACV
jgi:hypothetical protein